MKRHILRFSLTAAVLFVLSGCFGGPQADTKIPDGAADSDFINTTETDRTSEAEIKSENADANASQPPSFSDGQLYLKAIASKDVKLCAKIQDAELKSRCQKDAAPKK